MPSYRTRGSRRVQPSPHHHRRVCDFFFSFHSLPGRFFSPLLSTSESLGLRGDPPIWDSASPPRLRNPPKTTTAADLCVQDKGITEGPLLNSHTRRTTQKAKVKKKKRLRESARSGVLPPVRFEVGPKSSTTTPCVVLSPQGRIRSSLLHRVFKRPPTTTSFV